MKIPPELSDVLQSDPGILQGTICFRGTRVSVEILFDYINTGEPLEKFLKGYPGVCEEHARAVLSWQDLKSKEALGLKKAA